MKQKITLALAGNPNCGKTTIFNSITGSNQHVGNYPGVTVEKREGSCRYKDRDYSVVDLPGTYSLTANSEDEVVARNYIIEDKADIIVNVVDAENLERNLYLTVQLLEFGRPLILVLNMADMAKKRGIDINTAFLSDMLKVPVVQTVGNRSQGIYDILDAALTTDKWNARLLKINYGPLIEAKIEVIMAMLQSVNEHINFPLRWLAVKLLENDRNIVEVIKQNSQAAGVIAFAENARAELKEQLGDDPEIHIADCRYRYVTSVCKNTVVEQLRGKKTVSDKIDDFLTNRILGLPIFFALMWLMFNLVFTIGEIPKGWMENGIGWFTEVVAAFMPDGALKELVVDGIIGGVGAVIVFLPDILLLFLGIALLEDSGYMARAAFVMDRIMRAAGLHGKSFIPMLMGFGCTVPAVMGTRTLENPRDRLVTILVSPFVSCSARLPVYTVLISAFFTESQAGTVLFSIYFLGIMLAVIMAKLFRATIFRGDTEPFVMELPPYRFPTIKSVVLKMWERSVLYLKKAGTFILAASIVVWFMVNYPAEVEYSKDYKALLSNTQKSFNQQVENEITNPLGILSIHDDKQLELLIKEVATNDKVHYAQQFLELQNNFNDEVERIQKEQQSEKLEKSYAGKIGKAVEPLIKPLGLDWKIGVGLITAITAKEVLVSTLGTIYKTGEVAEETKDLQEILAADSGLTPLSAYSLMVFVLIYSPCLAVLAVIKRETNSWKWTIFAVVYTTFLAWVMSFLVMLIGKSVEVKMENILLFIVGISAVGYILKRFLMQFTGRTPCSSCSNTDCQSACKNSD